jgi:hypothetical protein
MPIGPNYTLIPNDWIGLEIIFNDLVSRFVNSNISTQELTELSHDQIHGLVGSNHTVSGLTTGHVLKALSATTFGFAAAGFVENESDPVYSSWYNSGNPTLTGLTLTGFSGVLKATAGVISTITDNSANWNTAYSHSQIVTGNPHSLDYTDIGLSANQVIDWTANTANNFLISGTLGAGAITGTSFIIGANTLDTTEWALLDGVTANKLIDWTAASSAFSTSSTGHFGGALDTDSNLTIDGTVGIGVTPSPTRAIYIGSSFSSTSIVQGVAGIVTQTRTGIAPGSTVGLNFQAFWTPSGLMGGNRTMALFAGAIAGCTATSYINEINNMTITKMVGFSTFSGSTSFLCLAKGSGATGTVTATNVYHFEASDVNVSNDGVATTQTAFYTPAMTAATTNWGLGINTQSYINGNLRLGSTVAPTCALSFADAKDINFGSTTGTKIGSTSTEKLAFWGKTPVVQLAKASYNNWAALGDVVNALVALGLFDTA